MNNHRRLTKESIKELQQIHSRIPGKREQKKIQKAKFDKVQKLIAKKSKLVEAKIVCPIKLSQKIQTLLARQPEPTTRFNPQTPLRREVPFGPTTYLEDEVDADMREKVEDYRHFNPGRKLHPGKPTQRDRVRIIKAKIEAVKEARIMTANLNRILEYFTKDDRPSEGSLMTDSGDILHHKTAGTHYEMTRIHAKDLGLDLTKPYGHEYADDEDVHKFLQKTNTVRVQHFPRIQKISLHIPNRLTSSQISRIKDLEKEDPNLEIGYAVGRNFKNMAFGSGVRNLLSDHARQFGQKGASQEGEENMTFQKSKKIKLLKEMFRDERVKRD